VSAGSAGLLSTIEAVVVQLRDLDPGRCAVDECVALVERLARLEKMTASVRARVAARVEECGRPDAHGFATAAEWLARATGRSTVEADRELDAARQLERLPLTRDAVRSGELSLAQAGEVAKTVACCPNAEQEMVELAQGASLRQLRDGGRKKRMTAISADELHARQRAARFHRQWRGDGGMVRYSGAMMPEVGVPFMKRMEVATDRHWRATRRSGPVDDTHEQLAADAFADIVNGGGRAHAIRADVVYVCDLNTGAAHVVGGGPVPTATLDAVAREGFVKAVVHDGTKIDSVVHYGRRALPAAVRTAVELGDPPDFDGRRCVDCGNLLALELDHDDPVANGGPTTRSNMKWRCNHCHREKTERDRRAGLLSGAAARAPNSRSP